MTTKFTNIKYEVFTSKEHYLAFRQAWKDYINSGKAKTQYEENGYGGKVKSPSALTAQHHLLYSILIGGDLSRSFRPSSMECKKGFYDALYTLWHWVGLAKSITEFDEKGMEVKIPSYLPAKKYPEIIERQRKSLKDFCEPFGNTLTPKMLAQAFEGLAQKDFSNEPVDAEGDSSIPYAEVG